MRRLADSGADWTRLRFGKMGLLENGSFQKSQFSEVLENLKILEILENPPDSGKPKKNPTTF